MAVYNAASLLGLRPDVNCLNWPGPVIAPPYVENHTAEIMRFLADGKTPGSPYSLQTKLMFHVAGFDTSIG